MKDVAILTLGSAGTGGDAAFRNDVAELEGRLRFIFTGWELAPVFGGEPCHPGDRVVTSLALGRLHLHHVVDAGACVLVALLAGDVDPRLLAEVVRYADARARPPFPLFVMAPGEIGPAARVSLLRAAGELRAIGREADVAFVPAIHEDDPAFHAWAGRVEASRDAARPSRGARDVGFRDDLRRHHHLSVCPGNGAPPSWRLPPIHALAQCGITASVVDSQELERRARWLLGAGAAPLDPRLAGKPGLHAGPGALAEGAVALAIRDLADERLAFSVALGPSLPSGASAERVALLLNHPRDAAGSLAMPLCAAPGDDDAGALTQHLLQRAALPPPDGRPFIDPARAPAAAVATTLRVEAIEDGHVVLGLPGGCDGNEVLSALAGASVTAARIGFGIGPPRAAWFEATPAQVAGGRVRVPVPGRADGLFQAWPADRAALVPARCGPRFEALLRGIGFEVTRLSAGS
jgi:hypothetical protein